MTWALSTAGLIFFGAFAIRLDLDWPARIATALTCGIVIGGTVMFAESMMGVRWSVWTLGIPAILCGVGGVMRISKFEVRIRNSEFELRTSKFAVAGIAIIILLTLYGAATARMTAGDLLYFWGPKAQHFFDARQIDVEFLRFPHYYLMHPDYPPLLPLVSVWNSIFTGGFSLWGAVLVTPLFLLVSVLVFRGYARSNDFALLLAAVLGFGLAVSNAAGGADPLLVMFEVVALSAMTWRRSRADDVIAAMALAGAAFTKVEGTGFVFAVVAAAVLTRKSAKPLMLAIPTAVLLGSWIAFSHKHGLLDSYARNESRAHLENLGLIAYVAGRQLSYGVFYLPWIASLAPLAFARSLRRAALPLIAGVACIAYTLYFYLHAPDPVFWIKASVERVLLTSLAAFVVASAAASE